MHASVCVCVGGCVGGGMQLSMTTRAHTVLASPSLLAPLPPHPARALFLPSKEEGLGGKGMHASVCVCVCVGGCGGWNAAQHDS